MISRKQFEEEMVEKDNEFFLKINTILNEAGVNANPVQVIKYGLMLAAMECRKSLREQPLLIATPIGIIAETSRLLYHTIFEYHVELEFDKDESSQENS